jgi:hypothetical protein
MNKQYIRKNKSVNKVESLTYELLISINFFKRYEKLCKSHRHPTFETMDGSDIVVLLKTIQKNGYYKAKISNKKTIKLIEKINKGNNLIKLYISKLDIGVCEFQIYFNSQLDEYLIGEVGASFYRLKQYVELNNFERVAFPYPNFKSYEEFEDIFKEFVQIYEDFKNAIIECGIRTKEDIENIIE